MIRSPGAAASMACGLTGLSGTEHGGLLAADRDGHRVDGLLAVGRRDEQLAALRGTATVLRLLLDGARGTPAGTVTVIWRSDHE